MNIRALYLIANVIMVIALLAMGFNWLVITMPDWAVRIIGVIVLLDLAVIAYLSVRTKVQGHCLKSKRECCDEG